MRSKHNIKTLGPQAAQFVISLQERNQHIFTSSDVVKMTGLKSSSARSFVRALVNRGVAARLRPGLFQLVPYELGREMEYLGNPYVVARELMAGREYYISHASAMDIHHMATQPQLVVFVTSPLSHRKCIIFGTEFRFVRCQRSHFFGFSEQWVDKQEKVLVSDLERTVLDGLKAPENCGGFTEVAKGFWMRRSDFDLRKLMIYCLRMNIKALNARLGYLMEVLDIGTEKNRSYLREQLGGAYVLLDPTQPAEGKFMSKWRLRLNITADEIRAILQT